MESTRVFKLEIMIHNWENITYLHTYFEFGGISFTFKDQKHRNQENLDRHFEHCLA